MSINTTNITNSTLQPSKADCTTGVFSVPVSAAAAATIAAATTAFAGSRHSNKVSGTFHAKVSTTTAATAAVALSTAWLLAAASNDNASTAHAAAASSAIVAAGVHRLRCRRVRCRRIHRITYNAFASIAATLPITSSIAVASNTLPPLLQSPPV